MVLNPDNYVYLPALVVKELLAGHEIEITGCMFSQIKNTEDYKRKKDQLAGKFGEIISTKGGAKTVVATRSIPPWAEAILHKVVWDAPQMEQWKIPEVFR